MVAYEIDTSAVMDAVRRTEAELAGLASLPSELQRGVHTVETALGSSRVARVFTAYGTGELLPDWRSVLSRAEDAVQGVTQAVAEYLRGDEEMRARAEAAAATVPEPSGQRGESTPPPTALPIVPLAPPARLPEFGGPDSGPARAMPAPVPRPLPPPQKTEPDPEPGTLVPLPGPPPWRPEWLFRPALPGRPPMIAARDLMLRLYYPCPGGWPPYPGGFRPRWWGPAYPPGAWIPRWPVFPPGGWYPRWPVFPPGLPGPAYPPGGWYPRWPVFPPGGWYPRWPEFPPRWPVYPPGGWYPRWPEPGLPPRGRFPWQPARPLPGLFPNPRITPHPGPELVWPLETKRLPFALAVDGPAAVSGENSSGKWGLT